MINMDIKRLKKEMAMNKKMSTIVNMVYSFAMIIEGVATDLGELDVANTAGILRAYVHTVNNQESDEFGMWSEELENEILNVADKDILLPALCYKIYTLSRKLEDNYRRYEPRFDFVHMVEVMKLKAFSDNKEISIPASKEIGDIVYGIIKE